MLLLKMNLKYILCLKRQTLLFFFVTIEQIDVSHFQKLDVRTHVFLKQLNMFLKEVTFTTAILRA